MNQIESTFLTLLRDAIAQEKPHDPDLSEEEWESVFQLSNWHQLLPLILDLSCSLPSCVRALRVQTQKRSEAERTGRKDWRARALSRVGLQVEQENEFLNLILMLREKGLEPLTIKGPVCRSLYPKPLLRPSVDDDLLIPGELAQAYHAAFLEFGLRPDLPNVDVENAWEISYHKPDSPLYVELHKKLFDPSSPVFEGFQREFDGVFERSVTVRVQDVDLHTLAPTDHLLFLILHAFKHFLHSGFGARIVADICLFPRAYCDQIDFSAILRACREKQCDRFTAAIYRIGAEYLGIPEPELFREMQVEIEPLLRDILDSGLHGAQIDRLHSANITLGAVSDHRTGKRRSGGLRKVLFRPASELKKDYPFLTKYPVLLPAAWCRRVWKYLKEPKKTGAHSPTATLRIGEERVQLLSFYGIIQS